MATYAEIQQYVVKKYNWVPNTCWIAHCQRLAGIPTRDAWNRSDNPTECPPEKRDAIISAFVYFGMPVKGMRYEKF